MREKNSWVRLKVFEAPSQATQLEIFQALMVSISSILYHIPSKKSVYPPALVVTSHYVNIFVSNFFDFFCCSTAILGKWWGVYISVCFCWRKHWLMTSIIAVRPLQFEYSSICIAWLNPRSLSKCLSFIEICELGAFGWDIMTNFFAGGLIPNSTIRLL